MEEANSKTSKASEEIIQSYPEAVQPATRENVTEEIITEAQAAPNTMTSAKPSGMLHFAEAVAQQMQKHRDCLVVLGRGFSVPKMTACFLHSKFSTPSSQHKYSPYLIFLLNFDEVDFAALSADMLALQSRLKTKESQPISLC